jgi:WD40 repeat protein
MPRVFISYSQDSQNHASRVLTLANRLVTEGIDCYIDQYEPHPPENWPLWMDKQIRDADYVLMICTRAYYLRVMNEEDLGKGLGVLWEGNLIYQHLYGDQGINRKFIPALIEESTIEDIPVPVRGTTRYRVDTEEGYEALYRYLTKQPLNPKPHLGRTRLLLPSDNSVDIARQDNDSTRIYGLKSLSDQIKSWFSVLGYRFEEHELHESGYFEYIINIPSSPDYKRVYITVVEGEAESHDVDRLSQATIQYCADEGWLVAFRRISRAARVRVRELSEFLFCYSLDQLLERTADFNHYFKWLKEEVIKRGIDKYYLPLSCIKTEDFNARSSSKKVISRYAEEDGWIDGYLDLWLDDSTKQHISILGEFGTGKTWLAFHYSWRLLLEYEEAVKTGRKRPRIPILIPLREFAKAVSIESLFSRFFFRKYQIPLPNYEAFQWLNSMGKLLLIFDGFDEMASRVDHQQMITNFLELSKAIVPGAKAILTSRTEHFIDQKESYKLLNTDLRDFARNLNWGPPQFEILELEPFNDQQIRQALLFRTNESVVQQIMSNKKLLDLSQRPIMTELILDALPDIEAGRLVDISRVYFYAICKKMESDVGANRTFTSLANKLYFLCELSWYLLSNSMISFDFQLLKDKINNLFSPLFETDKDLEIWCRDMLSQTLIIRNSNEDYFPAHRSLLEFFVAYKFVAELGLLESDFVGLARKQDRTDSDSVSKNYTWSGYFKTSIEEKGSIPALDLFCTEEFSILCNNIGKSKLTKATLDLMLPMLIDSEQSVRKIVNIALTTRNMTRNEIGYTVGNFLTLAVELQNSSLESQNLSDLAIVGANLTKANLRNCDLSNSDLSESAFMDAFADNIFSISFSSDGNFIAIGGSTGGIAVLQTDFLVKVHTLLSHSNWVRAVSFDLNNNLLVSGSDDQTVKLWDLSSEKCTHTFRGHVKRIRSVVFSPNGRIVASGSDDMTVKLWDINEKICLYSLSHNGKILSLTFSNDGQKIASASDDKVIKIWDANTGLCLDELIDEEQVLSIVFSPDGSRIVGGYASHKVKMLYVGIKQSPCVLNGHTDKVSSVAFSSNGQFIASGSADGTISLWDGSTGCHLRSFEAHAGEVGSITFSPNSGKLATGGSDSNLKLWDVYSNQLLSSWQAVFGDKLTSIDVSSDGQNIVSGGYEQILKVWNINTEKCTSHLVEGRCIWSVLFSLDSQKVVYGSDHRALKLWDISTGKSFFFEGHSYSILAVAISLDETMLGSGSDDFLVKVWSISNQCCIHTLAGHMNAVWSVIFHPSGRFIVSGGDDMTIKIWDIEKEGYVETLTEHSGTVWSLAFSPDGTLLASGSGDKSIKIWDFATRKCIMSIEAHDSWVMSVAFSSDANMIVSSSDDRSVKIWSVESGRCLQTFRGHTDRVWQAIFCPNSQLIASCSEDGTIKIWDFSLGSLYKELKPSRIYDGMNITNIKGISKAQKTTLKNLGAIEGLES